MFRIIRSGSDGLREEGNATEAEATAMLTRGLRLRTATVEAHRRGAIILTWTVYRLSAMPIQRTVTAEPFGRALTPTMYAALRRIGQAPRPRLVDDGRILALGEDIARSTGAHLFTRQFLARSGRDEVRLALPARLALLADDHRTRTTAPHGWYWPADRGMSSAGLNKPAGRCGRLYDGTSWAGCSCGQLGDYADSRTAAAAKARAHRQQVTAAFVEGLCPPPIA
ncbi:hypothetical protein JK358_38290 [Nocardia sp. 2]|uniref:Uncharacterized protein n=1 Tax=Nocardia acididurans TaxID=2802282 RepID=A0ABS1MHX9_9NOCA|nr:hypothetical protein [Nocardia acididurans]MBL1080262.1 hypothetical protein [Nocardia acididurans]